MRRNAALLLAARIVSAGTTLLMLAIIGRSRGAEALGIVGIGFAIGAIAAAIADAGTATFLVRESARRPERAGAMLGVGLAYRVVAIPLVVIVVALVVGRSFPGIEVPLTLVAAGLIVQSAAELTRAVFNARQRMAVSAGHSIVENAAWMGSIAIAILAGAPLSTVFAVALVVLVASLAAGLALDLALAGVRPALPSVEERRDLPRKLAPFAAFSIVGIAYSRVDPFLIGLLAPSAALAAAGAYFAASRLVAAFEYVPEALARAVYPELALRTAARRSEVLPLIRRAGRALLVLGIAVPAMLIVGGEWILQTVFGSGAGPDAWIVGVLSIVVPFRFLGYLYGTTLTSADAQGRRVAAAAAALLVVVAIDVALIPRIGIAAPVMAAVLAAAIVTGLYARSVATDFGSLGIDALTLGSAVLAVLLATALGVILRPATGPGAAMLIVLATYIAVAWAGPLRGDLRDMVRRPTRPRGDPA